ncbi:ABC transporter permease [Diplocloster modestus]|uniref:ABC transporter permease n=1 Tax=Diplocloster modestus TaxID=2850322 RepID=A0ABS6K881_9FIRM|nr:ABC transporter permease [Diplocloster modestus]MBU9726728.1 ABC transporter permease [Diplocloster modestus]
MKTNHINKFLRDNMTWVLLIVISIIFSFLSPNFFSFRNIINILNQNSYIIISALGIAFIMMAGEIDIAVGYTISLTSVLCAMMAVDLHLPAPVILAAGILIAILLECMTMLIAHYFRLQLMMVTIGTMTIFQGISFVLTQSKTISGLPESYKIIGQGYLGSIPIPVIVMVILFILASFVLNKTYMGRYVFAIGGNAEAARLAGISVFRMKMMIAGIAGGMVGLAATFLCTRLGAIQANTGAGLEFTIITAVLLGGVSVRGGEGRMSGVVAGVLILAILSNGMQLAGMDVYYQFIAKGVIMLATIGVDVFQLNRKDKVRMQDK